MNGDREPTAGSLRVVVRPHWVSAWMLVPFARPYVGVDGQDYACRWNRPLCVEVAAGRHVVAAFMRYRGVPTALGTGHLEVNVSPGCEVSIEARNGWMNHMPFSVSATQPAEAKL